MMPPDPLLCAKDAEDERAAKAAAPVLVMNSRRWVIGVSSISWPNHRIAPSENGQRGHWGRFGPEGLSQAAAEGVPVSTASSRVRRRPKRFIFSESVEGSKPNEDAARR